MKRPKPKPQTPLERVCNVAVNLTHRRQHEAVEMSAKARSLAVSLKQWDGDGHYDRVQLPGLSHVGPGTDKAIRRVVEEELERTLERIDELAEKARA